VSPAGKSGYCMFFLLQTEAARDDGTNLKLNDLQQINGRRA
jgi:hypothetical protein